MPLSAPRPAIPDGRPSPPALRHAGWRRHGFLLGLGAAVAAGFLLPAYGARGGPLHPEIVSSGGIALILFLQGLSLALEQVRRGAGNWRLHLTIQLFTFAVFPLLGLLGNAVLPGFWPDPPPALRDGFLYLCVLPSTVSTSVVLTAVARGNTAGALFNAALSNLLGVVLTPLLVQVLLHRTGRSVPLGPLLLQLSLLTLVPFAAGVLLRPRLQAWVDPRRAWVARLSNAVILFIVYTAFCDSVQEQLWPRQGAALMLRAGALVLLLFTGVSVLVAVTTRLLRLNRGDRIAAYFCAVKKTLAMGVPLALLIFGPRPDLTLILLPLMLYHPLQLLVNGGLASRWGRETSAPDGAGGPPAGAGVNSRGT